MPDRQPCPAWCGAGLAAEPVVSEAGWPSVASCANEEV